MADYGSNAAGLNEGIAPAYGNAAAVFLALLGVGAAYALAPFGIEKPAVVVVAAVFPILLIAMLGLPALQCLRLGPRILLILLALRPLVDVSTTAFRTDSAGFTLKASSGLSLQEGFAAVFGILLVVVWVAEGCHSEYAKVPNLFLTVLLGLTSLSWLMGGLSDGVRGFARTAWGLLVALLLGTLVRTEQQIDIFIRTVFYSSFFVLMAVGLNLSKGIEGVSGDALDEVWRLGGQYGTPNALAGVAFSFFLCGLYVFGRARTARGKLLSLLLLSLLAAVIVSTQSRTVGALMLVSVGLWLWASGRRRLLYLVAIPALLFALASTAGTGWRLISSFSLTNEQFNPNVLTLQGRMVLWGEWMVNYSHASLFHKIFGLGWGAVLQNFLSMRFFTSSVTESSFLWFLLGTGALGLLAFSTYLFWVLFKSWGAWRRTSSDFERQFALLAFLTTLSFVIEAFTTDIASSPNTNVYIFAVMSMFVFQRNLDHTGKETNETP
jgi:hypothetical protein